MLLKKQACPDGQAVNSVRPQAFFTNFSEAEFMQYRRPVGCGPSSNTCPRWASRSVQFTSSRIIPRLVSRRVYTFSSSIVDQKLGQPDPDSNFVSELNTAL